MIEIILISIIIICIVSLILLSIASEQGTEFWNKKTYITLIVTFIICISIGMYIDNQNLKSQTEKYLAYKQTLQESLESDKLSGLERIELVKLASEQNVWLKQTQYKVNQWYGFYYSKDVLEIKAIDIKGD